MDHTYNRVNLWKSGGAIKCYILEAQPGTMLISCAGENARHGGRVDVDIKCSKQYVSSFTAAINLVLITHHHHLIPHPPLVTGCLLHAGEVTIFSQHTLCIKALSMIIESAEVVREMCLA